LLTEPRADAFLLLARNLAPPGELVAFSDSPVLRLFRNRRGYRYEGAIHEQIRPSIDRNGGRVEPTNIHFIHTGYQTPVAQGKQRRAERNRALLERAIDRSPKDAYLRYQLGATYKALGDCRARFELEQALALDVTTLSPWARVQVLMKLAQIALSEGDNSAAREAARRCVELDSENAIGWQVLALACLEEGRMDEARAGLIRVLKCASLAPGHRGDVEKLLRLIKG
jgi:tetratricopeptide (TPR) repeat protein